MPDGTQQQQQEQRHQQQQQQRRQQWRHRWGKQGGAKASGSGNVKGKFWGYIEAAAYVRPDQLAGRLSVRLQRYAYTRVHCSSADSAVVAVEAVAIASYWLARQNKRLLILQPQLLRSLEAQQEPFSLWLRISTVPWGPLPECNYLGCRPDTDGDLLADAVAGKIDREGFTQVCCSSLSEAPKALMAMAEAREWLRLYRVKDFSVAVQGHDSWPGAAPSGGDGGATVNAVDGEAAWALAFTVLEVKWDRMTYFKY